MKADRCLCSDACRSAGLTISSLPVDLKSSTFRSWRPEDAQIGVESLQAGLVDDLQSKVKILGDGELTKRLLVAAHVQQDGGAEDRRLQGTATRVGGKETRYPACAGMGELGDGRSEADAENR